jgi:hypothetical protein
MLPAYHGFFALAHPAVKAIERRLLEVSSVMTTKLA